MLLEVNMRHYVEEAIGNVVGLAANQVGYNCQLAVIRADRSVYEIINPQYLELSDKRFLSSEGCFSLPFFSRLFLARRSIFTKIEAIDRNGEQRILFSKDKLGAALLQHEMDHLEGILTINSIRRTRFLAQAIIR